MVPSSISDSSLVPVTAFGVDGLRMNVPLNRLRGSRVRPTIESDHFHVNDRRRQHVGTQDNDNLLNRSSRNAEPAGDDGDEGAVGGRHRGAALRRSSRQLR